MSKEKEAKDGVRLLDEEELNGVTGGVNTPNTLAGVRASELVYYSTQPGPSVSDAVYDATKSDAKAVQANYMAGKSMITKSGAVEIRTGKKKTPGSFPEGEFI